MGIIFFIIDIGEGQKIGIIPAEEVAVHIVYGKAAHEIPHRAGLISTLKPFNQCLPPVYGMKGGFCHPVLPAWNRSVKALCDMEKIFNDGSADTGHITGNSKEEISFCFTYTGMNATDRTRP